MFELDFTSKFEALVAARRATRQFLSKPLSSADIDRVLEDAQYSPSNCNTQPWHVHIVSGQARDRLSAALLRDEANARRTPDFSFDTKDYDGVYAERHRDMAKKRNDAEGIERADQEARRQVVLRNLDFYGAPHAAFLFLPPMGDNVRVASDIGMYAQTFLLSLTAHGFAGIPQTMLGFYAQTIREQLEVPADLKLLFGISFGYADPHAPSQWIDVGRAPLSENVTQHD